MTLLDKKYDMSKSICIGSVVKSKFKSFEIEDGEQLEINDFSYSLKDDCFYINFFEKDLCYEINNLEDSFELIGYNIDTGNKILNNG